MMGKVAHPAIVALKQNADGRDAVRQAFGVGTSRSMGLPQGGEEQAPPAPNNGGARLVPPPRNGTLPTGKAAPELGVGGLTSSVHRTAGVLAPQTGNSLPGTTAAEEVAHMTPHLESVLDTGAALLYLVASAGYGAHLLLRQPALARVGRIAAWGAVALQTGAIGVHCAATGRTPFTTPAETLMASAWAVALLYLVLERVMHPKPLALGAFALPAAFLCLFGGSVLGLIHAPGTASLGPAHELNSRIVSLHVVALLFAFGLLTLAFGTAVLYLLQHSLLKRRGPEKQFMGEKSVGQTAAAGKFGAHGVCAGGIRVPTADGGSAGRRDKGGSGRPACGLGYRPQNAGVGRDVGGVRRLFAAAPDGGGPGAACVVFALRGPLSRARHVPRADRRTPLWVMRYTVPMLKTGLFKSIFQKVDKLFTGRDTQEEDAPTPVTVPHALTPAAPLVTVRPTRHIDEALFEELEEALIASDLNVHTTLRVMEELRSAVKDDRMRTADDVMLRLKQFLTDTLLAGVGPSPMNVSPTPPTVFLFVGVNGVGKTTSIAKLAHKLQGDGERVVLAAGDTFRAAAADQLTLWGERVGVDVVRGREGGDPASVVYDALQTAQRQNADYLLVDTAGRLHNKSHLMDELKKMNRVLAQGRGGRAADETLLVLDATTGQNAINQAKEFKSAVDVSGLVLAKLDGTARGGIVITIKDELNLPIKLVGTGEKAGDIEIFNPRDFVESLFA